MGAVMCGGSGLHTAWWGACVQEEAGGGAVVNVRESMTHEHSPGSGVYCPASCEGNTADGLTLKPADWPI